MGTRDRREQDGAVIWEAKKDTVICVESEGEPTGSPIEPIVRYRGETHWRIRLAPGDDSKLHSNQGCILTFAVVDVQAFPYTLFKELQHSNYPALSLTVSQGIFSKEDIEEDLHSNAVSWKVVLSNTQQGIYTIWGTHSILTGVGTASSFPRKKPLGPKTCDY